MTVQDTLTRFYEAESLYLSPGGGDFSVIAETLDEDVVIYQATSLPYSGEWRGHEGFRRWMEAFSNVWSALRVVDPRIYICDHTVFSHSTVIASARATGKVVEFPLLQKILVKNDKIVSICPFYWDTAQLIPNLTTDLVS